MKVIGKAGKQEIGRWLNNLAENFHLPFRRRERAILRFGKYGLDMDDRSSPLVPPDLTFKIPL